MYGLSGIVIVIPDSLLSRVIDANGTVVVEYTYDAWGKVLNVTGDDMMPATSLLLWTSTAPSMAMCRIYKATLSRSLTRMER